MALQIPKDDIPALAAIKSLSEASLAELLAALSKAPKLADSDKMAEQITEHVPSIDAASIKLMLDTLYTFYQIRQFAGVKAFTFLTDIIDGVKESDHLEFTDHELDQLKTNLEKLLSIDNLGIIAKAKKLQRVGERLYCNAKIMSDIRPVFSDDPSLRPSGAVITHTLTIAYHGGSEHSEFHVALDSEDVDELADVLARAGKKDETLRKFLKESKFPDLGL